MKTFICDQMCSELGRWLRIAGYDTEIIQTSMLDQKIFEKAVKDQRLLLTRDKYFKQLDPEGKTAIYLRSENLDEWAEQLKEEVGVNWLFCPFSRCLQCNSVLKKTLQLPEEDKKIPKNVTEFWICPTCQHLFWRGSHTERMENRLKEWQNKDKRGLFLCI